MKKYGARRPTAIATAAAPRAARAQAAFVPLQIFAEGDSWFDYPPFLLKGGIITRLEKLLGVPILNLAKAGDEVRFMLGVEQRLRLIESFQGGCPAGGPWDAMMFSGGGNDMVDNPLALWLLDWNDAMPPESHLNKPRFDAALSLVQAGYEDLIQLRDRLSPQTHLFFHGYDFAIPDGRGVCNYGPWLKPAFDVRGFPADVALRTRVVRVMLTQFAQMVSKLALRPRVTFLKTQGTLDPTTDSWHNELHPISSGFEIFAKLFQAEIKKVFPNRVN